jgi:hypothetical protein
VVSRRLLRMYRDVLRTGRPVRTYRAVPPEDLSGQESIPTLPSTTGLPDDGDLAENTVSGATEQR